MASGRNIQNIEQQFYHYEKWEDYQSGMYDPPCISSINTGITSDEHIEKAIELLSEPNICEQYMRKVVTEWKIATQQVLTNPDMNGKAWLGQCACFMYGGCHDEETRKAWCMLKPSVQKVANNIAKKVINEWLVEFAKKFPNYQFSIFD